MKNDSKPALILRKLQIQDLLTDENQKAFRYLKKIKLYLIFELLCLFLNAEEYYCKGILCLSSITALTFDKVYCKLISCRDLSVQYYTDILIKPEFKEFLTHVLSSYCILTYYQSLGKDYVNMLVKGKVIDDFYKSIHQVPMYRYVCGITQHWSLYVLINGNPITNPSMLPDDQVYAFKHCSLMLTLLHEFNHFIRRYINMSKSTASTKTPEISDLDVYNN
jgi:hypothetical protein